MLRFSFFLFNSIRALKCIGPFEFQCKLQCRKGFFQKICNNNHDLEYTRNMWQKVCTSSECLEVMNRCMENCRIPECQVRLKSLIFQRYKPTTTTTSTTTTTTSTTTRGVHFDKKWIAKAKRKRNFFSGQNAKRKRSEHCLIFCEAKRSEFAISLSLSQ